MQPVEGDRLDSWKAIAAYLGRGERTVRRWEELEGLPVHRLTHEKRGSVYAYRSELDAWWAGRKEHDGLIEEAAASGPETPAESAPAVGSSRKRLWLWIGAVTAALAAAGISLWVLNRPRPARFSYHSIAVLPFDNLSHSPTEEWFSDGITETLITELSKVDSLTVISRTSAMQYRRARKTVRQIGSELRVGAVVEGSALRVGDHVRITAQLIDTATDTHLWGTDFDGDFRDVLVLQRKVAQSIAQQVGLTLSPQEAKHGSPSPDAMAAYLKGLYQFNRGNLPVAINLAREAIHYDPQLPAAHELLGMALHITGDFHSAPYSAVVSEARGELTRALELDPNRAIARSFLGWSYLTVEHDWLRAEKDLRSAFQSDPRAGDNYAFLLSAEGRYREAIQAINAALVRDPLNPLFLTDAGRIYHFARRYDDAVPFFRKAIEISPAEKYPRLYLPLTLLLGGRQDEAFEAWLQLTPQSHTPEEWRELYRRGGWNSVWQTVLVRVPKTPWVHWRQWAAIFLNRTQDALDEAEQVEHTADALQLEDAVYDPLRKEPRFQAMLKRIGYPQSK